MSGFLRFLGSALLFLFIATIFFGNDLRGFFPEEYKIFSDDLTNNKWLLLISGIVLSMIGSITKVKDAIKKSKKSKSVSNINEFDRIDDKSHNISSHENTSFRSSDHTTSYKNSSHNTDLYSSYSNDSNSEKISDIETLTNNNHIKQGFVKDHYQYKGREFANKQSGHLKEIAMKVDWTPLRSGGANFKTDSLKQINLSRLEVQKSTGAYLFSGIFALLGNGTMLFGTYAVIEEDGLSFVILAPVLFGGLFAAVGIGTLIYPRPRIMDRRYGWYWSGSKSLAREQDFMKLKKSARLSDIAAIQIIDEHCSGNKGGSYTSWEINLVSKDGQRLNVMDHGNKDSISADARKLGEFLGVPVWENT